MDRVYSAYIQTQIGSLKIMGTVEGITFVGFVNEKLPDINSIHPGLKDCIHQLDEYFKGKRKEFTVKLLLEGTEFQKRVWNQLIRIPYGETVSYKDVAEAIGNVKAVRAVGNANGSNNISIIIPCHRVIGNSGKLVGYGGGLDRKQWLLDHEAEYYNDNTI
jgi:methylated-DNA-[protein]-cysteine S-methyltransferase